MPSEPLAEPIRTVAELEPVAEKLRYPQPRARIDPDRDKGWFSRLLPVALSRRLLLTTALVSGVLGMLASAIWPAVLGFALNDVFTDTPQAITGFRALLATIATGLGVETIGKNGGLSLESYVAIILLLGVVRTLASSYTRYSLYRASYHIETDLRSIIYEHLTRLSFSFYDRTQSGQIISRANSDIRSVQMFLTFAPLMSMTLLSFVAALGFMLSMHVGLTVAAVVALPGVLVVGARLRKIMFPLSWLTQSRVAELATIVDENINGVRVVKAFAAEERQIAVLARAANRVYWAACEMVEVQARHAPLMENIARLGPAFVLLYGGHLVMTGELEGIGTLVAFNTYMIMLQAPFRIVGFFVAMSQRAAASAYRIFEIMDEPVVIEDKPDAQVLSNVQGRVEFRDVTFGYGEDRDILKGFSLDVRAGETIALVGRTGCGKSTVARLLARFYDVQGGSVHVDGHEVRDLSLTSLRGHVGLALDEPFLFSMSVRDNIAYGRPDASDDEVIAAAQAAQAHDFIEQLDDGYDTVVGERGYTLSGGERQRISLSRLFLTNPPVLVLDDATSSIDVQVESKIHAALRELLRDRTTIVIAHRESTIGLADRVVLMEQGKVVATGTHAELMRNEPRYAAVLAHAENRSSGKPAGAAPEMSP